MNKEDKKLQKHLVDEMMKVSKTNPDVMIYMQTLMENYEKLEQKVDRLNNIINELEKCLEEFDFTALICGNRKAGKSIELGARLNNDFILDKLKELKEDKNGSI